MNDVSYEDSNSSSIHLLYEKQKLQELEETVHALEQLKSKESHQLIVPINSVGFMEGHVSSTAPVRVALSKEIVVECSIDHALGILDRRRAELEGNIKRREQHMNQLSAMCKSIEGSAVRAVEDEEEESVLQGDDDPQSSLIKSDEEILAMLDRMEKLEMEAETKSKEVEDQGLFKDPILKIHKVPTKQHEKRGVANEQRVANFMGFSGDVREHDISLQTASIVSVEETSKPKEEPQAKQQKMSLFKQRMLDKDSRI